MFVGENHLQLLKIARLTPKCEELIIEERVNTLKESKPKDLDDFLDNFIQDEIDTLLIHLADLEIYIKKNKFLQGDFVCGVCNPFMQKFLRKESDTIAVDISMDTCSELMELDYFENKTAELYQTTIAFYLRVVQCIQNNDDDDSNDIDSVLVFDNEKLYAQDAEFEECYVTNN